MSARCHRTKNVEARWGISAEELKRRQHMPAKPVMENEFRCPECNLRVTRTNSNREVGHARGRKQSMCPNHPDFQKSVERQGQLTDW